MKLYIELKKSVSRFLMYPLCITTIDKSSQELEFDGEAEAVVYVEGMKSDALVFSVVESQNE